MTELDTMYRVMILYMLDRVEYPLTNTQITNFILEKDYTTYFVVQQTIQDLLSSELITAESTHSNTRYRITEDGRETLRFFPDKISDGIKEDIRAYFSEHRYDFRLENSVYADFYKAPGKGYQVRCQIKEDTCSLVDLTMHVDTREQAQAICANWKEQNTELYALLMDTLLK